MGCAGGTVIRFRRVEIGMGGHDDDGTREEKFEGNKRSRRIERKRG